MKKLFYLEVKRAFFSKGMLVSLSIGAVIAIYHFLQYQLFGNTIEMFAKIEECGLAQMFLPDYIWSDWMVGDIKTVHGYLYLVLLPILAILPHGTSYLQDIRSKYTTSILARAERKQYYFAKWSSTFLAGGFAVTVPLLMNFILFLTVLPLVDPHVEAGTSLIEDSSMFATIYYTYPYIYILICLSIIFIFGSLYATLGLLVSLFTDYAFIAASLPCLIMIVASAILEYIGASLFDPQTFLRFGSGEGLSIIVFMEAIIFVVVSFCVFVLHGLSSENV
jgi:hypothetical protein